jgi:hypothetical protein
LRLSIHFREAQSGAVLPRLALRDQTGKVRRDMFLSQELWSPDQKILTVLFDPGRLKTGIGRRETMGPPLAGLSAVTLTLDGSPLKRWRVDQYPCQSINPELWRIEAPQLNTRSPLRVKLPEAVDIQSEHLLAVVDSSGQRVSGTEQLTAAETLWLFKPGVPWLPGEYRLVLHPDFENPCGDRVDDNFEHSIRTQARSAAMLKFVVRQRR